MNSKVDYVDIGDTKLRYLSFGEGKTPLVIIPGLSLVSVIESGAVLMSMFKEYTEKYTFYVIDRRVEIPDEFTIHDMALDELKAIKALGLKGEKGTNELYVYGASLGGMIIFNMALMQPNVVNKAVIASSTCRLSEKQCEFLKTMIPLAVNGKKRELVKYMGDFVYTKEYMTENENALMMFADNMKESDLKHFAEVCNAIKPFDLSSKIKLLPMDIFVVGATDDALFGDEETKLISKIKGCKSYIYQGSCHGLYDLEPDFRPMMFEFFNS